MSRLYRTRWFWPSFSLFLGALMLAAFWIGGDLGQGLSAAAVMVVVAALFSFGGRRSETLAGIGGPPATSAGSGSTSTPPRSPAPYWCS